MKNFGVILISILVFSSLVQAEEFNLNEDNKTSSTFVVDPDPLDPLPSKKESIKDGDEIVLDGIKDIIDDKVKIIKPKVNSDLNQKPAVLNDKTKKIKKSKSTQSKNKIKSLKNNDLTSDQPDINLENRLHQRFQKFNIDPTSPNLWSQATTKQKMNIYEVQKNDTLFTISKILFGDSQFWPKIWSLNKSGILNPHYIYPGMKIYFYAGDGQNPPTLQLESKNLANDGTNKDNYFLQNTETRKTLVPSVTAAEKEKFPSLIPDSLPLTKNKRYFYKDLKETQTQLREVQYQEKIKYTNPYLLTSSELKADFEIPKNQLENLICNENQYIAKINKLNVSANEGSYMIVKKLSTLNERLKNTYKYKSVGEVTIDSDSTLRIINCSELLDTDTLIVSQEKINLISEPNENLSKPAHLVDGLDFLSQEYFTESQFVIVNQEGFNLSEGSEVNIYSDELGKNVGLVKILQLSGTMAIGVITKTNDIIKQGDRLTD